MWRSTQWGKSTNSNDNWYININYEVLQLLPKELEEHKTINNKDGILDRVSTLCRLWYKAYAWERKIQSTTSTRGRTILCQKAYYLSASQARPMPTTDVVGGGLPSMTHGETRVKSSCFHFPQNSL